MSVDAFFNFISKKVIKDITPQENADNLSWSASSKILIWKLMSKQWVLPPQFSKIVFAVTAVRELILSISSHSFLRSIGSNVHSVV